MKKVMYRGDLPKVIGVNLYGTKNDLKQYTGADMVRAINTIIAKIVTVDQPKKCYSILEWLPGIVE